MPLPDCSCKVINGRNGYARDNSSWIIGRLVRDYESWMDLDDSTKPIRTHLNKMIEDGLAADQKDAEGKRPGSGKDVKKRTRVSLCVSVYEAQEARPGTPGYDTLYYIGFLTALVQLGIAAIPCGLFGDWGILLITAAGILLSFATGSLSQWKEEKWACRENSKKPFILTRGNGSQHAFVILGTGKGLDLEDLAAGPANVENSTSYTTRITIIVLAALWTLLLITAAGIKRNTWFLLAIGGLGILQNIFVAGRTRVPSAYGIPLKFKAVYGEANVMATLFAVEKKHPRLGKSMLETFFPGKLSAAETKEWDRLEGIADEQDAEAKAAKAAKATRATRDPALNHGAGGTSAAVGGAGA